MLYFPLVPMQGRANAPVFTPSLAQVLPRQKLQPGHLGVGHFERDDDVRHVSAALSAGADAGTRQCSRADVQPGRFQQATNFNQNISVWDTSKVTMMHLM